MNNVHRMHETKTNKQKITKKIPQNKAKQNQKKFFEGKNGVCLKGSVIKSTPNHLCKWSNTLILSIEPTIDVK